MLADVPLRVIAQFIAAAAGQVLAIGLLPRTLGFTDAANSIACVASFSLSLWLIARILQSGVNLSILVPLMSAISPLGGVLVAILVYREHASLPKVAALAIACGLIGLASRMA
jgi:quaternary ammonium compound-resistance protein SugE